MSVESSPDRTAHAFSSHPDFVLDRNGVSVAWLETETLTSDDWARLEASLSPAERERAAGFRFRRDREAYVAAHALLRRMLSWYAAPGPAPDEWRFVADARGRPEIAPDRSLPPLRFNLSHTHGVAAVAVTLTNDVGVDVECLDRASLTLDLADRFFAPAETAQLAGLPATEVHEALYAFWTLKEAYAKAVGLGLSLPLDSFAFTLDPLALHSPRSDEDDPRGWLFERMRPGPAHVLALALRHADPGSVRVCAGPVTRRALFG